MNEAQRQVLKMLESGVISAAEANRLLAALGGGAGGSGAPGDAPQIEPMEAEPPQAAPAELPFRPTPPAAPGDVSALAAASSGEVLRQLAQGEISAEEASARLSDPAEERATDAPTDAASADFAPPLEATEPISEPEAEPIPVAGVIDEPGPDLDRLRRFWQTPFLVALGIAVIGALCMSITYGAGGLLGGLGFLCGWSVFMLAVLAVGIAFWSRTARWVHVRVEERDGQRIRVSLPVPMRFMDGILRVARPFVRGDALRHMELTAEFLASLDDELQQPGSDPLVVDVDEDGDRVRIYFG